MPAWSVIEEHSGENSGGVFFGKTRIEAILQGARCLNDGELIGLRTRREKDLDEFEETRQIPLYKMIDKGWWTSCAHCGIEIKEDLYYDYAEDDPDGRSGEKPHGTFDGLSFCREYCMTEWDRRKHVERGMAQVEYARLRGKVMANFHDPIFAGERPPGRNSGFQSIYRSEDRRYDGYYIGWLGSDNASFDWCNVWFRVPSADHWALCRYHDRRGHEGGHTTISFPDGSLEDFRPHMKKHLDRILVDA
jgi:hypothetical protein